MKLMVVFLVIGLFKYSFEDQNMLAKRKRIKARSPNLKQAYYQEFPYLALIKLNNGDFCAGTLISHRYVLTAARCVSNDSTSIAMVYLGKNSINQPFEVEIPINNFKPFCSEERSEYCDQNGEYSNYDIALIELSECVPFSDLIQPAELPSWMDLFNDLTEETSSYVGWEIDYELVAITPISSVSHVESNLICFLEATYHLDIKYDSLNTLCTIDHGDTEAYIGNIGGPLVINEKVYGVAMANPEGLWDESANSQKNKIWYSTNLNMFTKVTSFLSWIDENTDICIGLWGNTIYE